VVFISKKQVEQEFKPTTRKAV